MRTQQIRDILYLDCQLVADPDIAPIKSMAWVADKLVDLCKEKAKVTYWTRDRRKKVYVRDFSLEQDILWLLLYTNDADAPDASFSHFDTDDQRDEAKGEGEGRPESAHVAIHLTPVPGRPFRHLMLVEEASSLPRIKVERYINWLLRQIKVAHPQAFKHPHPNGASKDGKPVMLSYKCKADLIGHLSKEFQQDLAAGALRGISLETSSAESIGFGEGSFVTPVRKSITLATKSNWRENPLKSVREAVSLGKKNNLEVARILFATSDNTNHTALLDTDTGGILNDGYIKRSRINNLGILLHEASTSISLPLKNRISRLISDEMELLGA